MRVFWQVGPGIIGRRLVPTTGGPGPSGDRDDDERARLRLLGSWAQTAS